MKAKTTRRLAVLLLSLAGLAALACPALAGPKVIAEEPLSGRVRVTSNVDGATFELAGNSFQTRAGKAVILGDVPAGRHQVTARLEGYEDWSGEVEVEPGKTAELAINLAPVQVKALPREMTNSIGMKLILLPAGSFLRGSKLGQGFADERPQREITFTKPIYMGAFEVTQLEWQKVTGENPAKFRESPKDFAGVAERPVERVSWDMAVEFCAKLSALEGQTYRLPTEAEWERACRAGGDVLPGIGVKGFQTRAVGQGDPNLWGFYDMQGNVWEWCSDWYNDEYYADSPDQDPQGPDKGNERVCRGGSFRSDDASQGSTGSNQRGHVAPHIRSPEIGLRVVLEQ